MVYLQFMGLVRVIVIFMYLCIYVFMYLCIYVFMLITQILVGFNIIALI
jgi:hypothetical protein